MECASPDCSQQFDPETTYEDVRRVCGQRRTYCSRECARHHSCLGTYQRPGVLKRKYGITIEDYNQLFETQRGVCAICGLPEATVSRSGKIWTMAVDHDHKTGRVRGLLCTPCNRGIGFLRDDTVILEAAVSYLNRARG